jgi:ABC-type multidrug transport system permease subunit
MKATMYLSWQAIKLYSRTRAFIFTMVLMPLLLFFIYLSIFAGGNPARIVTFLGPVLVLMATMNGIYGIGGDLLMMRETGTLVPYRLTPVTALQILVSRLVVDCLLTLLVGTIEVTIAVCVYRMPLRAAPVDLFIIGMLATLALGTFGAVIVSVSNGFPQASMLSQVLFLTLLILSGMSVPLKSLPRAAQRVAEFLPTTALVQAFDGVLTRGDRLNSHWREVLVLALLIVTCGAVAVTLFRWEQDQKATSRDRLLAGLALLPLIGAGLWFNLHR